MQRLARSIRRASTFAPLQRRLEIPNTKTRRIIQADPSKLSYFGKRRRDAVLLERRKKVASDLPQLMMDRYNSFNSFKEKTSFSSAEFRLIFGNMFKVFQNIIKTNSHSLEFDLKRKGFKDDCASLIVGFRNSILKLKAPGALRYPWDTYEDYKDYCRNPSLTLSWSSMMEGLRKAPNQEVFIKDTFQAMTRSFFRYVDAGVESIVNSSQDQINMTNPASWYPAARAIPRKVYLHIGPTNSGKTYNALQAFQNSKKGFYAGPLRLLAKEVYNRMKTNKKACSLITGEEIIEELDETGEPSGLASGTVEMMDMKRDLDIAIIDEIQMIEDRDRGWAWTNAFFGVRAKEVHCCGDPNSESMIRRMVQLTGDSLEVIRYQRLSPLEVDHQTLNGRLSDIRPGDCIVAFSKKELFALKNEIEKHAKGSRCAVIYGSLPADTRSKQAMEFNDPKSRYKYLVASDAIGMGLNLAIRRVIFTTIRKFDGIQEVEIPVAQVKQIGGRAGRYKIATNHSPGSADPTEDVKEEETGIGKVTTLYKEDLEYVKQCLASDTPKISRAGLFPPEDLLREFATRIGMNIPFYQILQNLQLNTRVSSWFFMTDLTGLIETAKLFSDVDGLLFEEMATLSKAPVAHKSDLVKSAFKQFCKVIASGESRNLLEIPFTGIHTLQQGDWGGSASSSSTNRGDTYEMVHKVINLYLWLSYRFPTALLDRRGAMELKELCEDKIARTITLRRRVAPTKGITRS